MKQIECLTINGSVAADVIELLLDRTKGPQEAFATICIVLLMLNDINNTQLQTPVTREGLIEELAASLRSVESIPQGQN